MSDSRPFTTPRIRSEIEKHGASLLLGFSSTPEPLPGLWTIGFDIEFEGWIHRYWLANPRDSVFFLYKEGSACPPEAIPAPRRVEAVQPWLLWIKKKLETRGGLPMNWKKDSP